MTYCEIRLKFNKDILLEIQNSLVTPVNISYRSTPFKRWGSGVSEVLSGVNKIKSLGGSGCSSPLRLPGCL